MKEQRKVHQGAGLHEFRAIRGDAELALCGTKGDDRVEEAVAAGIAVAWVIRTSEQAPGFFGPCYEVSSLDEDVEIPERTASMETAR